jgi:hypothetical protein
MWLVYLPHNLKILRILHLSCYGGHAIPNTFTYIAISPSSSTRQLKWEPQNISDVVVMENDNLREKMEFFEKMATEGLHC